MTTLPWAPAAIGKRWLILCALALAPMYCAYGAPQQTATRHSMALDHGWQFRLEQQDGWQQISLPHSFNATDSTTSHYYRGNGYYRLRLPAPPYLAGRRHFLEFDGALQVAEVWLNGQRVGQHTGGYTRFRFDLSHLLKRGSNLLEVRVDNRPSPHAPPLGGDYTMAGGLYRKVRLVSTAPVHFDMLDAGGPGVYLRPSQLSAASAQLDWNARVRNDSASTVHAELRTRLRDASGRIVAQARRRVTLPPYSDAQVALSATLAQPHRWQGVNDPYLYRSEAQLLAASQLVDQLNFQTGLRDIVLDPQRGLLLNGVAYATHGVNLHQTFLPGHATAVTDADIERDYRIMQEMGVTALRHAHYPHAQYAMDLADRLGWLVWAEIPLNAAVSDAPAFLDHSVQQLRELIRQNQHHPAVMVWGLGNEIYRVDDASARTLSLLQHLAKQEDPTRATSYANCCSPIDGPQASHTDAVGSNVYYGWYDGEFADLGPFLDANHQRRPSTPLALSEYGAGAAISQQEDPPRRPVAPSRWHPEQYQALYHEAAWRQLAARPWLWGQFIWVGFDFPSAGRNEGAAPGMNDKGLVSFDRQTRKDAYYWYQANWSSRPMVYISSRRFSVRTVANTEVKVYSNQASARLTLNGRDMGEQTVQDHIARWQLALAPGNNQLSVTAGPAQDAVQWQLVGD